MLERVAGQRFLRGNFGAIGFESDAPDLMITGKLPRELNGTLFRNGPNPMFAPRDQYHMFSGDGMVHAFKFAAGRVSYRNRWVRTQKLEREIAAGQALFGTFGNPATSDPAVVGLPYHLANTNVIWHGQRLLALEEFNLPFELDPHTLASLGSFDYAGALQGPMTAHPKLDPKTGELHFFGYGVDGLGSSRMAYHVADADGHLLRTIKFDAPYAAMVHDFILTEQHVLFPIFPLTISPTRAARGLPLLAWEPAKGSTIGCLSRSGDLATLRWIEGEACCVFHPLNSYEDGAHVIADMLRYDAGPGFPGPDGSPPDPSKALARLERWRIPLAGAAASFTTERLDQQASEYPRLDERYAATRHRYGYFATTPSDTGRAAMFDQLARVDFNRQHIERFSLPAGDFVSEPVFVPRAAHGAEGDGYLLAVVYRGREERSDLIVLDAQHIEDGPFVTAHLETRVPFGFHGNWMPVAA